MPAEKIGRYEIERELGRGGMAVVHLARDPNMNRMVAVKVLPRQFTYDAEFLERFRREAEFIAALEHPYIVPVYDFGQDGDQPFIVMRYMPGGSLAERMRRGLLPLPEIVRIVDRISEALDEAHTRRIVHRDLKPGNILFDARGQAYLSDFGIAKIAESAASLTASGIMGTPAYMSPEQARGAKHLDGRSDVYALGIILFELLTGKLPYEADTPMGLAVAHITQPVPSILTVKPDLPPECSPLITRALAKEPGQRYATPGDLARAVKHLSEAAQRSGAPAQSLIAPAPPPAAIPAHSPPPAQPPIAVAPPARPRLPLMWIGVIAVGACLCGAAAVAGGMALGVFNARTLGGLSPTAPLTEAPPTSMVETPVVPAVTDVAPEAATPTPTPEPTATPTASPSPPPVAGRPQGRIVFVCFDGNDDELCLINADGTGRVQLTSNEVGDFYPSLAGDGSHILFARQISGANYEIFRISPNGADVVQLTSNGAENYSPTSSPDGRWIAYTSTAGGTTQQIWVMDANGENARQLTGEGQAIDPAWSPDGELISFASTRSGKQQLWVMRADGSEPRQVTDLDDMGGRNTWSVDGRALAFYAGRRDDQSREVYLIDLDGGNLRRLTDGGDNLGPSFSPDGEWIAFVSFRDGRNTIYVMRADGTGATQLTAPTNSDYQPRWGP